jgi:hypothetical protein
VVLTSIFVPEAVHDLSDPVHTFSSAVCGYRSQRKHVGLITSDARHQVMACMLSIDLQGHPYAMHAGMWPALNCLVELRSSSHFSHCLQSHIQEFSFDPLMINLMCAAQDK